MCTIAAILSVSIVELDVSFLVEEIQSHTTELLSCGLQSQHHSWPRPSQLRPNVSRSVSTRLRWCDCVYMWFCTLWMFEIVQEEVRVAELF